jgi:hypothetical protein
MVLLLKTEKKRRGTLDKNPSSINRLDINMVYIAYASHLIVQ